MKPKFGPGELVIDRNGRGGFFIKGGWNNQYEFPYEEAFLVGITLDSVFDKDIHFIKTLTKWGVMWFWDEVIERWE